MSYLDVIYSKASKTANWQSIFRVFDFCIPLIKAASFSVFGSLKYAIASLQRTLRSLDEFVLEGITTTIDLHKKILTHDKFINSDFDTNWLAKEKII